MVHGWYWWLIDRSLMAFLWWRDAQWWPIWVKPWFHDGQLILHGCYWSLNDGFSLVNTDVMITDGWWLNCLVNPWWFMAPSCWRMAGNGRLSDGYLMVSRIQCQVKLAFIVSSMTWKVGCWWLVIRETHISSFKFIELLDSQFPMHQTSWSMRKWSSKSMVFLWKVLARGLARHGAHQTAVVPGRATGSLGKTPLNWVSNVI